MLNTALFLLSAPAFAAIKPYTGWPGCWYTGTLGCESNEICVKMAKEDEIGLLPTSAFMCQEMKGTFELLVNFSSFQLFKFSTFQLWDVLGFRDLQRNFYYNGDDHTYSVRQCYYANGFRCSRLGPACRYRARQWCCENGADLDMDQWTCHSKYIVERV